MLAHNARKAVFLAVTLLASTTAWAVTPFAVKDIRVEGLQRVEPGTVFATLPFRIGDTYDDEKGSVAIRSLFALGVFKDVRVEVNGDVLVLIVEERPTVAAIEFSGTKEFDKEALNKAMREIGLSDGRPFDKALLDKAEQELKRQYLTRSLYAAEVVTTVTPIERNRVNLTFSVVEGDVKDLVVPVWTNESTGKTYENVFELGSKCNFPNTINEGDEFYFVIDSSAAQNCAVCMLYYPVPPKKLSIKVIQEPCAN